MKWGFDGLMVDFASPIFKEISQESQVTAKKMLRKLLKKSHFNLLI